MRANELLAIPGGMISAIVWIGIIRAFVRDRLDADAVAFKSMAILMMLATVLGGAFPQFAIGGIRGTLITVGYLAVMAWFWRSRHLRIVATESLHG